MSPPRDACGLGLYGEQDGHEREVEPMTEAGVVRCECTPEGVPEMSPTDLSAVCQHRRAPWHGKKCGDGDEEGAHQ